MSVQPCIIRKADESSLGGMASLLASLFTLEQDFQPDRERQLAGLRLLMAQPDHAAVLVAQTPESHVIGMVTGQLVISTAEGAPSLWVEDLIIAPTYRHRGIARRLLEAALQWAREHGATRAQLLADADNAPAAAFYQHVGWQQMHMLPWRRSLRPASAKSNDVTM